MLSPELAKRLKIAGYEAEETEGNFYSWCRQCTKEVCGSRHFNGGALSCYKYEGDTPITYLPSLSQLLAEGRKRGYKWHLSETLMDTWKVKAYKMPDLISTEIYEEKEVEDAVAHALLEITQSYREGE
jgi:hypothetical protein